MPAIADYRKYNSDMKKSRWDKAFFADKIPGVCLIVDFGCADGSLMSFVEDEFYPRFHTVGYDNDPTMVEKANKNGIKAFGDLNAVVNYISEYRPEEIAVNFSSVLHEVFHYGAPLSPITAFIRKINPAYIIVRDMMYEKWASGNSSFPTEKDVIAVKSKLPSWQVKDFEDIYEPITEQKNFMHLLLKYRYTDNWERECKENYFSFGKKDIVSLFTTDMHTDVLWAAQYIPPWIVKRAEDDFGIKIRPSCSTHSSYIFRRDVHV